MTSNRPSMSTQPTATNDPVRMLSCPECGYKQIDVWYVHDDMHREYLYVARCARCGEHTKTLRLADLPDKPIYLEELINHFNRFENYVRREWNRRAADLGVKD